MSIQFNSTVQSTRVNTVGNADTASIAALTGGGYVIAYKSEGSSQDLYLQRYDANGAKVGAETLFTVETTQNQFDPSVTALAGGGFVVSWTSNYNAPGYNIYQQAFNAGGVKVGTETLVAAGGINAGVYHSANAGLANGSELVVWRADTGSFAGVIDGRLFDAAGASLGSAFHISTNDAHVRDNPIATALTNGGYAVAWQSQGEAASGNDIYVQLFAPGGAAVGGQVLANTALTPFQSAPSIAAIGGGGFVVGWTASEGGVSFFNDLYMQRFDAAGAKVGGETQIHLTGDGDQTDLNLVGLADGGFVATWQSGVNNVNAVVAQRFDANGVRVGTEQVLQAATLTGHSAPVATGLAGGGYVISWSAASQAGGSTNLYQIVVGPADGPGLTTGADVAAGDGANDVLALSPTTLTTGDQLDGGGGSDTLQLSTAGTYNFTGVTLSNFEILQGSAGDDVIAFAGAPPHLAFNGGGGVDTLKFAGDIALSSLQLSGVWKVMNVGDANFTLTDVGQLSQAWGGTGSLTVDAHTVTLTAEQRAQLFAQGVDHVVQGSGVIYSATGSATGTPVVTQGPTQHSGAAEPMALLSNGDYVVVGSAGVTIKVYRHDHTGQPLGSTIQIGEAPQSVDIAAQTTGGFAVTWTGQGLDSLGQSASIIRGQFFANDGTALAGPVTLNPQGVFSENRSEIAGLTGGGYVLAWHSANDTNTYVQRVSGAGALVGALVTVSGTMGSVEALAGGGFIIGASTFNSRTVVRYDASGSPVGGPINITDGNGPMELTGLVNGGWLVTWVAWAGSTGQHGVLHSQEYDAAGAKVGAERMISSTVIEQQTRIDVVVLADGGQVFTWSSEGVDVYSQRYDASGGKVGAESHLTHLAFPADPNFYPQIVSLGDGGYLISYPKPNSTPNNESVLTPRLDYHVLTGAADVFNGSYMVAAPGDLGAGDILTGSGLTDRLEMSGAGVLNLAAAQVSGFEQFIGSSGDDTFLLTAAALAGATSIDGVAGIDTVSLAGAGSGQTVDLRGSVFAHIENATGTAFNDVLVGTEIANRLLGGDGSDALYGLDGADILIGGGHASGVADYLYGGSGNDTYTVNSDLSAVFDLVFEGAMFPGSEAGAGDVDTIHSQGQFFWDFYSVGEVLAIDSVVDGGAYLVGGMEVMNKAIYGSTGTDIISTYGRNAIVDAGAGTDAISFSLYGLDESYRGHNTVVMKAGSGRDYVYDFRSGTDKIDLSSFHFGITGADVLAQAVNVDLPGTAGDYCYFYLTSAGGVDNFIVFMGLLSNQLSGSDFVM